MPPPAFLPLQVLRERAGVRAALHASLPSGAANGEAGTNDIESVAVGTVGTMAGFTSAARSGVANKRAAAKKSV
jgi:hypothetical protein